MLPSVSVLKPVRHDPIGGTAGRAIVARFDASASGISSRFMALVNLGECEARAREVIAGSTLDYYDGGSNDEITLRDNAAAFSRITLYRARSAGRIGATRARRFSASRSRRRSWSLQLRCR